MLRAFRVASSERADRRGRAHGALQGRRQGPRRRGPRPSGGDAARPCEELGGRPGERGRGAQADDLRRRRPAVAGERWRRPRIPAPPFLCLLCQALPSWELRIETIPDAPTLNMSSHYPKHPSVYQERPDIAENSLSNTQTTVNTVHSTLEHAGADSGPGDTGPGGESVAKAKGGGALRQACSRAGASSASSGCPLGCGACGTRLFSFLFWSHALHHPELV